MRGGGTPAGRGRRKPPDPEFRGIFGARSSPLRPVPAAVGQPQRGKGETWSAPGPARARPLEGGLLPQCVPDFRHGNGAGRRPAGVRAETEPPGPPRPWFDVSPAAGRRSNAQVTQTRRSRQISWSPQISQTGPSAGVRLGGTGTGGCPAGRSGAFGRAEHPSALPRPDPSARRAGTRRKLRTACHGRLLVLTLCPHTGRIAGGSVEAPVGRGGGGKVR